MSDIGDMMAFAIGQMIVGIFLAGVAVTLFVVYGIPWLWHLAKPVLHSVTG